MSQGHTRLHSQSQAWETMLSQHAMHQPITGLGIHAIPEWNAVDTPYKTACRSSEYGRRGEGRLLWFLSLELSVNH